jgi:hypothetical protein
MLRAFGSIVSLESESTQFDANDAVIDTEPCGDLAKRGTLSPPQPATRREGSKGANGPRCRSRRATPRRASFTDVQARDCPDIPGTAAANPPAGVRRGDGSCDVDPSTWSVSTLALERPPHPMRRGSERSAPPTFAARRTARAPYDGRAGIEVFEAAPTPPMSTRWTSNTWWTSWRSWASLQAHAGSSMACGTRREWRWQVGELILVADEPVVQDSEC